MDEQSGFDSACLDIDTRSVARARPLSRRGPGRTDSPRPPGYPGGLLFPGAFRPASHAWSVNISGPAPFPPALVEALRQRDPADPLRIALVHGSHTGGHRSAANSLAQALNELPNVRAESVDTLESSSPRMVGLQKGLFKLVSEQVPKLRRWGFELALKGSPLASWAGTAVLKMKARFSPGVLEDLKQRDPDLVVSTHSQTNAMLSHWRATGQLQAPVHSVPTDFMAHSIWAQDRIDRYYVAAETTRQDLARLGVDPERVSVTGIPISPSFARDPGESREELASRLGLDPKLPTVLLMGGSLGLQPYEKLVGALEASPYPMQIVAITGRNEGARARLEALRGSTSHPLHVQGFVDNGADWMRAADVVVSKPGGLTLSELLALRKPVVVTNPVPGMEEAQVERLAGVAWSAPDADAMRTQVEQLLSDPAARAEVERRMDEMSRPQSSYTVAALVAEAALAAEQARTR